MQVLKAYKFRLYPTKAQETLFAKTAGCRRVLWNTALEQRQMWREGRKSLGYHDQAAELADFKVEFPWLAEVPHHCLQQALVDLDKAFRRFSSGLGGYPKRKRKYDGDAFRFPDPKQFRVLEDAIKLPKAGVVKAVIHRPVSGAVKNITVSRTADRWHASVQCEVEIADPSTPTGEAVGIDLGVAQPITLSDGRVLEVGRSNERERRMLSRRQRAASRKQRGSRNRAKAMRRVAVLKTRLARRKLDSLHKATSQLAQGHRLIAIEDLKVKNMTASAAGALESPGSNVKAKAGLNRSILEVSFGTFRRLLEYKTKWYGSALVVVPAHGTSITCHACGHEARDNRDSQAIFRCVSCGHETNADINAARNILTRAIAGTIAAARSRTTIRKSVKPRTRKSDQTTRPGEHGSQPAEPSVLDTAPKQEFCLPPAAPKLPRAAEARSFRAE